MMSEKRLGIFPKEFYERVLEKCSFPESVEKRLRSGYKYIRYECTACHESENIDQELFPCVFMIPDFLGSDKIQEIACPLSGQTPGPIILKESQK